MLSVCPLADALRGEILLCLEGLDKTQQPSSITITETKSFYGILAPSPILFFLRMKYVHANIQSQGFCHTWHDQRPSTISGLAQSAA